MAPGRRKGANKAKGKNDLSLGDLVLAKVKGFPAWPAKISRPEDWQHSPDPKKYFVEFFGTKEIAFVAPVDIQAFTSEVKTKLLNRCQGNKMKYFAQAAKEICEVFEESQQKKSVDLKEGTEGSAIECKDSTGDDGMNLDPKRDGTSTVGADGDVAQGIGDIVPGLGRCSNKLGETYSQDMKPSTSGHESEDLTSAKNHKVCDGDEDDDNICTKRSKVSTVRKRLSTRKNYISDSEDDSCADMVSVKNDCSVSETVAHGNKSKKIVTGSERKRDARISAVTSSKDEKISSCDVPQSGDNLKGERKSKISSVGSRKMLSPGASKSSLEISGGKKKKVPTAPLR